MFMEGTIRSAGKTAAGMVIPDEVVAALGPSRHPAVTVTIGGYTFRSSIARMGGVFMLPLTAETRAGAHVAAGDTIEIEIELDTAPREVAIPSDLAVALDGDPAAKQRFAALSYTNQRRLVIPIEALKGEAARERRVERTVAALHDEAQATQANP
jgi:antitoxin component of MazEF toxin-antitoxin module